MLNFAGCQCHCTRPTPLGGARRVLAFTFFVAIIPALAVNRSQGAVVIVANRTQSVIRFDARSHVPGEIGRARPLSTPARTSTVPLSLDLTRAPDSKWRRHTVAAGDVVAAPMASGEMLTVRGAGIGSFELRPYGVYYFGSTPAGKVELREIGLAAAATGGHREARALVGAQGDLRTPLTAESEQAREARRTISVAIFVDDEEPAVDHLWQSRLAGRLAKASEILQRSCGMKLAVKSFGKWETDDAVNDFELSLREFERDVRVRDVQVAIGFTNQYQLTRGRTHLGGTRGPLHSHILLREWSQHVSETERLELLVHEIAHFLGAAHSPESGSVMRAVLGDRQARAKAFRIAIDPLNALAMSVVGEEICDRGIESFGQLSEPSRTRLAAIYTTLAQAMPEDPASAAYLRYVRRQRSSP